MIDHLSTYATDFPATRRFYEQAFEPLGFSVQFELTFDDDPDLPGRRACAFGTDGKATFWVIESTEKYTPRHTAFAAKNRPEVDAFYKAGLSAGGRDNGAPNVDISALFGDNEQAIARVDQQLGAAIKTHGGFVISNFPEAESLDARARQLLRFFELPKDQKHQVAIRTNNEHSTHIYRGYESRLAVNDDLANNEMYDVGPARPFPGPNVPGMHVFSETNLWPANEPFSGWRQQMNAYYQSLQFAGLAVVRSIGRGVGFTEQQLNDRFARGNSTLRLINYPVNDVSSAVNAELPELRSGDDADLPLTFGRHVDSAGISLLWQAQPGLQAQAPNGVWRDVPQIENSISVHIGTVVQIMSDNQLPDCVSPSRFLWSLPLM